MMALSRSTGVGTKVSVGRQNSGFSDSRCRFSGVSIKVSFQSWSAANFHAVLLTVC
jgi:hypothetical protein